jgi:hypothetical protein
MIGLFAENLGEIRPLLAAVAYESVTRRPALSQGLGMGRALEGRFPGARPAFVVGSNPRVTRT